METGRALTSLEGVVVQLRPLGESSRMVELVTRDQGRVALLARGARRSRRRFPGALDLFVTLRAQATVKGGLWALEAADILNPRLGIRTSFEQLVLASVLADVTQQLMPEHQRAERVFDVLETGLNAVAAGHLDAGIVTLPRLLKAAGILPPPDRCLRCGARAPVRVVPLVGEGGWSCDGCSRSGPTSEAVFWQDPPWGPLPSAWDGILRTAASWVEAHTGRELKSLRLWRHAHAPA